MIISHTVVPPNGWQFQQGKINLMGETFDLLAKNVSAHRAANGIPQGDVPTDIERQLKAKYPHLNNPDVLA